MKCRDRLGQAHWPEKLSVSPAKPGSPPETLLEAWSHRELLEEDSLQVLLPEVLSGLGGEAWRRLRNPDGS